VHQVVVAGGAGAEGQDLAVGCVGHVLSSRCREVADDPREIVRTRALGKVGVVLP
jgi:hypothetical protein